MITLQELREVDVDLANNLSKEELNKLPIKFFTSPTEEVCFASIYVVREHNIPTYIAVDLEYN